MEFIIEYIESLRWSVGNGRKKKFKWTDENVKLDGGEEDKDEGEEKGAFATTLQSQLVRG